MLTLFQIGRKMIDIRFILFQFSFSFFFFLFFFLTQSKYKLNLSFVRFRRTNNIVTFLFSAINTKYESILILFCRKIIMMEWKFLDRNFASILFRIDYFFYNACQREPDLGEIYVLPKINSNR